MMNAKKILARNIETSHKPWAHSEINFAIRNDFALSLNIFCDMNWLRSGTDSANMLEWTSIDLDYIVTFEHFHVFRVKKSSCFFFEFQ